MRCHQFVGLNKEADKFLRDNVAQIPNIICPHCKTVISTKRKVLSTEHQDAFYGDGPTLHIYELKDGRICSEILQAQPWSSGPMSFLCLEIRGKKMFEWKTDESIRDQEISYEKGLYWV